MSGAKNSRDLLLTGFPDRKLKLLRHLLASMEPFETALDHLD